MDATRDEIGDDFVDIASHWDSSSTTHHLAVMEVFAAVAVGQLSLANVRAHELCDGRGAAPGWTVFMELLVKHLLPCERSMREVVLNKKAFLVDLKSRFEMMMEKFQWERSRSDSSRRYLAPDPHVDALYEQLLILARTRRDAIDVYIRTVHPQPTASTPTPAGTHMSETSVAHDAEKLKTVVKQFEESVSRTSLGKLKDVIAIELRCFQALLAADAALSRHDFKDTILQLCQGREYLTVFSDMASEYGTVGSSGIGDGSSHDRVQSTPLPSGDSLKTTHTTQEYETSGRDDVQTPHTIATEPFSTGATAVHSVSAEPSDESSALPNMIGYLQAVHTALMHKAGLYFSYILDRSPIAMGSAKPFSLTTRLTEFQQASGASIVSLYYAIDPTSNVRMDGYRHPDLPVEPLTGLRAFPMLFSYPTRDVHMAQQANIYTISAEYDDRLGAGEIVCDDESQQYAHRSHGDRERFVYFLAQVETRLLFAIIFTVKGRRGIDRITDSNARDFLTRMRRSLLGTWAPAT